MTIDYHASQPQPTPDPRVGVFMRVMTLAGRGMQASEALRQAESWEGDGIEALMDAVVSGQAESLEIALLLAQLNLERERHFRLVSVGARRRFSPANIPFQNLRLEENVKAWVA
ncbi:MAG: hypothetical protein MH204_05825 [Fimbriimonadaceae bacterium]|nr:hypothetical protein [Fimbriimonadaceae bacterium]